MGQKNREGAEQKSTGARTAARWEGRDLWRRGNPGDTRGAHVGGDVETPGPAPFRRQDLSFPHALYELLGSGRCKRGRYPGGLRRHLRSRHYRQLKRHMQLLSCGPGQLRARLPAAVPRDNKPLSRDSDRRWVAVARSLKGEEEWGACAVRSGAGPGSRQADGQ